MGAVAHGEVQEANALVSLFYTAGIPDDVVSVMPDADLELAAEGALFGGFGTAGQRCTSLGTVWLHRVVYDEFRNRFANAMSQAVIGDPTHDVLFGR